MSDETILVSWLPRKAGRGGIVRPRAAWVRNFSRTEILDIAADLAPVSNAITLTFVDEVIHKPTLEWCWVRPEAP